MHQPVGMRNQSGTERRNEAERKRVGKAKVQKRKKERKKFTYNDFGQVFVNLFHKVQKMMNLREREVYDH